MRKVFISYSEDDINLAHALKGWLVESGIPHFMASLEVKGGESWHHTIKSELDNTIALILICTENSMSSQEVLFEWAYAMGQGAPVIPIKWEYNVKLHSRLAPLSFHDFSDPRRQNKERLINEIKELYDSASVFNINKVGLNKIFTSRNLLNKYFGINKIVEEALPSSEVIVIARSLEAWAREYSLIGKAINDKSIQFRFGVVDPSAPKENWMITSDWARLDLSSALEKLDLIKISPESKGGLNIHLLPSSPLLSFVYFTHMNGYKIGILEVGASLSLEERTIFVFQSTNNGDTSILNRLHKMYSKVLESHKKIN